MSSSASEIDGRILRALRMEQGMLTIRQIAERLNASPNRIRGRVRVLVERGWLTRVENRFPKNEIGVIISEDFPFTP